MSWDYPTRQTPHVPMPRYPTMMEDWPPSETINGQRRAAGLPSVDIIPPLPVPQVNAQRSRLRRIELAAWIAAGATLVGVLVLTWLTYEIEALIGVVGTFTP